MNCWKCSQPIALTDIVESNIGHLSHVECSRPRSLTPDERHLLFVYCLDHVVAQCLPCGLSLRLMELAADPLGGRFNLCPRCRRDLTENARAHLYKLPPVLLARAREGRQAAQRLVKTSQQLVDNADVPIREAEAVLFESQQALRAAMSKRP